MKRINFKAMKLISCTTLQFMTTTSLIWRLRKFACALQTKYAGVGVGSGELFFFKLGPSLHA